MSVTTIQPGWYSLPGAAIYTGFSESSISRAIKSGKLPVRKVEISGSGCRDNARIKREHLDAWIEGRPILNGEDVPSGDAGIGRRKPR